MRDQSSAAAAVSLIAFALCFGTASMSGELPAPTGQVILEISGEIENTNAPGVARFDREMLESFGLSEIATDTPWTNGVIEFSGPLTRDVLAAVGAKGRQVEAAALNDYSVEIPITDFEQFNSILAIYMNGNPMTIRDRGPIWVIFPWMDHPELRNELYFSRSIWQLKSLSVSE